MSRPARGCRRFFSDSPVILAPDVSRTRPASREPKRQPKLAGGRPAAAENKPTHREAWLLLALALSILAAYSNSFQSGLVFDSAVILGQDPRIHSVSADNLALIFTIDYWYTNATSGLFRPLTTLSYLANYAVLGNELHPAGYHLVNLGLHIANVALVYSLGVLILEQSLAAVALAALWGLHPLLTESVTNIVGRADLLAAFGVLAGLLCAARSAQAIGGQKIQWLVALALAQTIGLFSKESAVVLPAMMLLYDLTWTGRTTWRERWQAYAAVALPILAFFFLRSEAH